MARISVEASITAQNQFTDWFPIRTQGPGRPRTAGLRIGDGSTFSATITVQTKEPDEATAAAQDIANYTTGQRKTLEFVHDVDVRVGCKTGNFTSGTIPVGISE